MSAIPKWTDASRFRRESARANAGADRATSWLDMASKRQGRGRAATGRSFHWSAAARRAKAR